MSKKETSSGVEKAEKLTRKTPAEKTVKKTAEKPQSVKSTTEKNSPRKGRKPAAKKKAEPAAIKQTKRESRKAEHGKKKLEAAKIKAEKKQKRLEKKLAAKQKRLDRIAAFKERRAERKEKRRERRDMLKHETKEERLERKRELREAKTEARIAKREAALEERQARREHRLKVRAEKRANRKENKHAPGFGGWLAAVISLGVTSLALGTMLTFGWITFNGVQADAAAVQTQSLYELNSIVDNLDGNLAKARVSNSADEQVRLLSDIAVESEMAEVILERLPMDLTLTQNVTSFVNNMGDSAQSMLYKVARGEKLSDSEIATIEYMYDVNLQLKRTLNDLTNNSTQKDMLEAMKGKSDSFMYTAFGEMENVTVETPKEIFDGPFAENTKKVTAKNLLNLKEITSSEAEELANNYFADYKLSEVRCTGEAIAEEISVYNVTMKTADGEMLAQISKNGGKVVMFDSYKDCSQKNFSVQRCIDIAEDFLSDLGYDDMKAVWTSENGTVCNLNFVYEDDGVVFYPDMIKVKVCEERGMVTGMEGIAYVLNHTERDAEKASVSRKTAETALRKGVEIKFARLAVIPFEDNEVLTYEFHGNYGGNEYYIYVDAATGEEIQVFTVVGTAQGRALL